MQKNEDMPARKKLTQDVFAGQPDNVVIACVDYDGLLKFGDDIHIRYTWASERWRGAKFVHTIAGTDYEPLTSIVRAQDAGIPGLREKIHRVRSEFGNNQCSVEGAGFLEEICNAARYASQPGGDEPVQGICIEGKHYVPYETYLASRLQPRHDDVESNYEPIEQAPQDGRRLKLLASNGYEIEGWYEENLGDFVFMDADWNLYPAAKFVSLIGYREIKVAAKGGE